MGYCTESDIEKTIAQALTSATAQTSDNFDTLQNLINVGNVLDKNQVTTDSLHRLSVVVPKNSLLTLDQITEILKEADSDVSVKRYERTVTGFEVMFAVRIPDMASLSTIQKGLDSLDETIELTILDARPII